MTLTFVAIAVGAMGVFTLLAQESKSQWDGVYTIEQAQRGEALYAEKCASCHNYDLSGGDVAPSLVGGEFTSNWNELTIGDLFQRIRLSMPQSDPGSLSRQQYTDVLAFILRRGNYPDGTAELPTQLEFLNMYKFLASKPEAPTNRP